MSRIGKAFSYFFIDLLDVASTRVQLVWITFIAWISATAWAMAGIPIIRELSIIIYRQQGIQGTPVSLDSPYTGTVLTMTGTAFVLVVGGYIGSNISNYNAQAKVTSKPTEPSKTNADQ